VRYECGGDSAMDTVLYYLGMAQLRNDLGVESKGLFERLIQHYPSSVYAEEALFRIGHASYLESNPYDRDQSETRTAIRDLQRFVDTYPHSTLIDSARHYLDKCNDKLAHKQFASARFYHRVEEYEAAIVYYRVLLKEYPASLYAGESKLYLAQALTKINRTGEARMVIEEILEGGYSSEIERKARQIHAALDRDAG
jgi:outer membrane protein assembly factor BamD